MKEEIKNGWKWALSHFWNLFSIVGVIATFYFSLFYIPGYAKENLYSKSALAQQEIIQDLGENIYNGNSFAIKDVVALIEQKEIFYKIDFPYSVKQTMLLVKNHFSNNHYIPLDKRNSISKLIQSQVDNIKESSVPEKEWWDVDYSKIISVILALLTALVGLLSIIQKNKQDAEVEIELDDENNPFEEGTVSHRGFEYTQMVGEVLKELGVEVPKELRNSPQQPVYGPEFEIQSEKGRFLIETKAYRQKVGVNTIRGFLYTLRQGDKPGVLVASSSLTVRAKQMIDQYKKKSGKDSVFVVTGVTKGDIRAGLKGIVA